MSATEELLAKLTEEIAMGWPVPWWPEDAAAIRCDRRGSLTLDVSAVLDAYIDLVGDLVVEHYSDASRVTPIRRLSAA